MQKIVTPLRARVSAWQAWGILALLSLIWGTSYVLIKWGLVYFPADQVGGIRLGVSALAFLPIIFQELRKINRSQLPLLFIVGLLGTGLPSFLFPIAQEHVNSSLAGILNSMTPLFTLLLGLLFFGSTFNWSKTAGILLGLAGALFLIVCCDGMGMQSPGVFGVLILLACICYAISTNLVGFKLQNLSALTITSVSFTLVGLPALFYLLLGTDFVERLASVPGAWTGLGYVSLLAIFSTVLAGMIFFWLIQVTSPVFGSTVSYLIPVVAMGWGAFDGEAITIIHFAGMALILFGVYLSKRESIALPQKEEVDPKVTRRPTGTKIKPLPALPTEELGQVATVH